ncbi:hypothetical protein CERSUDRAFT_115036 [Gelatoporia subvermispora B]|uniref:Uncharacterized protein n=1 Tax=Ceriporiopsis subvermispora (strain B) TaxID=914234 RepID=M2RF88_CERS8|nr:hypothetical protein CERSUDRAFT_115036 [Gelatoporia subvermispora B]
MVWTFNFEELRRLAPVMVLFVRDRIFYFALVVSFYLIDLFITSLLADKSISQVGTSFILACCAVASPRLYLNLRKSVIGRNPTMLTEDLELQFRTPTTILSEDTSIGTAATVTTIFQLQLPMKKIEGRVLIP